MSIKGYGLKGVIDILRELFYSHNITITEAAKAIGIRRETLHWKIQGRQPFLLWEAVALHKLYFSEMDFLEVFSEYEKKSKVR